MKKIINNLKKIINKTYLYLKNKGLLKLRGLISLFIAFLILYSPAYIQIIIGAISNNNALIASGIALFIGIATPIIPIGWTIFPIAIGVLSVWNFILKKMDIRYK